MNPAVDVRTEAVTGGTKYLLLASRRPLSFGRLFTMLETDTGFADWYSGVLAGCGYSAVYWEFPPIRRDSLDDHVEFVLLDAPALDRLGPNHRPFSRSLQAAPDDSVVSFPNLGGDALLIVPRPVSEDSQYAHLLAFLRNAPRPQVRKLWQATGASMLARVGDEPIWLNTAGLGVMWLHVRLDSRPKYYSHMPYKAAG